MGDEPDSQPKWGSYPAYDRPQPLRKTQEQVDASDAGFAYVVARCERSWARLQANDPMWRFPILCALMARYELLNEYNWAMAEERIKWIKDAFKAAAREADSKALCRDYHARWLTAYFWGQEGINRLEDRAREPAGEAA